MNNRRRIAWIVAGLLGVAFSVWVWPTVWSYDSFATSGGAGLMRRHRLTGSVEVLVLGDGVGWTRTDSKP